MMAARERCRAFLAHLAEIAAEHARDQLQLRHVLHRRDGDRGAVAHDCDAVADLEQLVELVADEHHRHALRLKHPDCLEQDADFVLGKRRGRFVHDHEFGFERNSARDRDHLLNSRAEIAERLANVDQDVKLLEQRGRGLIHPPPRQKAGPVADLSAKIDVLGHRPKWNEIDFLKDRADAAALGLLRRTCRPGPSFEDDFAGVASAEAVQHFNQS